MVLRYIFATKDSLAFHNSSSVYIIYFAQQEKTLEQGEFSRICDVTHFITEISRRKKNTAADHAARRPTWAPQPL